MFNYSRIKINLGNIDWEKTWTKDYFICRATPKLSYHILELI